MWVSCDTVRTTHRPRLRSRDVQQGLCLKTITLPPRTSPMGTKILTSIQVLQTPSDRDGTFVRQQDADLGLDPPEILPRNPY
jgi:hypothetical protein